MVAITHDFKMAYIKCVEQWIRLLVPGVAWSAGEEGDSIIFCVLIGVSKFATFTNKSINIYMIKSLRIT